MNKDKDQGGFRKGSLNSVLGDDLLDIELNGSGDKLSIQKQTTGFREA